MLRLTTVVDFTTDPDNPYAYHATIVRSSITNEINHKFYDPNNPDHSLMTNTVLPTILSSLKIIGSVSCAQVKLSDDNLAWNDDRTSLRINLTRQNENGDHWQIIIESIGETAKIELAQRFDTAITRSLAKALGYNLVQCQTRKFAALLEHPTDLKPAV